MFTIAEIIQFTEGTLISGEMDTQLAGISIDSRTIRPGDLFVAIKGEKFDGHNFIRQALDNQAAGLLLSKIWFAVHRQEFLDAKALVIVVDDPVAALGKIAHFYRKKFDLPVIAVTGSNGKTTTKEMIAALLAPKYNVLKSNASFNNHIGVPLSLLKLKQDDQVAVLELGMNHKGEIRNLSRIACPNIVVITNAAEAHLEFFNGLSEIVQAKCELLENLKLEDVAVVNADLEDLYMEAKKFSVKLISFGENEICQYRVSDIIAQNKGVEFILNKRHKFKLNMLGNYNVYNALAAIAVADYLGVDMPTIIKQLAGFQLSALRMEQILLNGIKIIADCYNANPHSAQVAIETLSEIKDVKRRILVFGDMRELGKFSTGAHRQIGALVALKQLDILITVGKEAANSAESAVAAGMGEDNVFICLDTKDATKILERILQPEDAVLLKGSRVMQLEEILEDIKNRFKD